MQSSKRSPRLGVSTSLPGRVFAIVWDLLITVFLSFWVLGGVDFHGHRYLRHGADPRRAAFILGIAGFLCLPVLRNQSLWIRLGVWFGSRLKEPYFRWGFYLLAVLGACGIAQWQVLAMRVPMYDVGIFHQILWNLSHGFGFQSTISGAGNFLQDHFVVSMGLLVPFFQLMKESPIFLPLTQVLLIFGGGAAWIFFAERVPGVSREIRSTLAAATTLFVLSFESLWGNIHWGFHENHIAFFSLSWAFAFLFQGASGWIVTAFLLVAALSKETLLLEVGVIFLVWGFRDCFSEKFRGSKRRWLAFAAKMLTAGTLFGLFVWFENSPHPADKNYFDRYYSYLGHNLLEATENLLQEPVRVVHTIGAKKLAKYFFAVFSPWFFLPILSWVKIGPIRFSAPSGWVIGILPSLASAALATYPALRQPQFHYVLELWPILAMVTLVGLARTRSSKLIWIWAWVCLIRWDYDPIGEFREYQEASQRVKPVRALMAALPKDASVAADELTGPWLAGRPWVTRWPSVDLLPESCPDYVILNSSEVPQPLQPACSFQFENKAEGWTVFRRSEK